MKKILLISFFISVAIITGLSITYLVQAATGSEYINIYGKGPVDCPTSGNCNQYHLQGNNCDANSGSCNGNGTDWVYRWDCTVSNNQIPGDRQCGGGSLPATKTDKGQGNLSLNTGSVPCGHVVQLDTYDKDCETVGWGNCKTIDYLVWYSGDCAAATATEAPTATVTSNPTSNPTTTEPPVTQPPAGPACGSPCSSDPDCAQASNGCNSCINGSCQTAPTPSPTPAFNTAMCACDGTQVSSLVPGAQATVTANYKIAGADQSKATMTSVTFVMYEGDNTTGKVVTKSDPIPVTITSINNDRTQYQAVWTFTVPTNVDPSIVYRITTESDCQASGLSQTNITFHQEVAGASTGPIKYKATDFWGNIVNFFTSLFGFNKQAATTSNSNTPSPSPKAVSTNQRQDYITQGQQIQLGTFQPATMLQQKACNILRFQFSTP